MIAGSRRISVLRWVTVAALGGTYAALYWRPGPFSSLYRAALVAGGGVVAIAAFSLVIEHPFRRLMARPPLSRAGIRIFAAAAPWMALAVLTTVQGVWWTQQASALRLFSVTLMAAWSLAWCGGPWPPAGGAARVARTLLVGAAIGLMGLSIDGLAFGLTPFGAAASALVGGWAAVTGAFARYGRQESLSQALALTVSTVVSLAVVEAGIRGLRLGESVVEVDDPDYVRQFHHIIPPRAAFVNQPTSLDEFPPTLIETNGFGTRGPEVPPGPVDLMIIGDSMVEARQLPWEDTLGARLPQALAARSVKATVVSQGVRGWSPLLYWNWYLKAGRQLQPRTVVVFFFWNDLWTAGDEERTFRAVMRPDGRPDYFDVPVEPWWVWHKHLRSMRLAGEMVERLEVASVKRSISALGPKGSALDLASAEAAARRMAGDAVLSDDDVEALLTQPVDGLSPRLQQVAGSGFWPGLRPLELWTDAQRQAAARTAQKLRLFAQDVAADGGRLVVLYVPNAFQVSASECAVSRPLVGLTGDRLLLPPDSGIQTWLRGVAQESGIELLDPSSRMRAFLGSRPPGAPALHLRADCHWSPAGHQFVADYLADWYVASGLPRR